MDWLSIFLIAYIVNVVLSLLLFEWIWKNTKRLRMVDDKLEQLYPAFCRLDAKHAKKWRHYIVVFSGFFLTRVIINFTFFFTSAVYTKICLLGHDRSKPIVGLRH